MVWFYVVIAALVGSDIFFSSEAALSTRINLAFLAGLIVYWTYITDKELGSLNEKLAKLIHSAGQIERKLYVAEEHSQGLDDRLNALETRITQ